MLLRSGIAHGIKILHMISGGLWQVGDDKTIKQWSMEAPGYGVAEEPINTILGKVPSDSSGLLSAF